MSILIYTDDTVVLGETENDLKLTMEELIRSKFEINENKTKYMCITREQF